MAFSVQREVVGSRERSSAELAGERPDSGVFALVTSEFVGAREAPDAVRPRANVRLFACITNTDKKHSYITASLHFRDGHGSIFLHPTQPNPRC